MNNKEEFSADASVDINSIPKNRIWYQALLKNVPIAFVFFAPFILAVFGGLIGCVLGPITACINYRLFRTRIHTTFKYLLACGTLICAFAIRDLIVQLIFFPGQTKAIISTMANDPKGVIEGYSESIKNEDKNHSSSYLCRAMAKMKLGDNRGAIEDCTQAMKLGFKNDRDTGLAFLWRARAKKALGDKPGADLDYQQAGALGEMEY